MDINWQTAVLALCVIVQWLKNKASLAVDKCKQALIDFWEKLKNE